MLWSFPHVPQSLSGFIAAAIEGPNASIRPARKRNLKVCSMPAGLRLPHAAADTSAAHA